MGRMEGLCIVSSELVRFIFFLSIFPLGVKYSMPYRVGLDSESLYPVLIHLCVDIFCKIWIGSMRSLGDTRMTISSLIVPVCVTFS